MYRFFALPWLLNLALGMVTDRESMVQFMVCDPGSTETNSHAKTPA